MVPCHVDTKWSNYPFPPIIYTRSQVYIAASDLLIITNYYQCSIKEFLTGNSEEAQGGHPSPGRPSGQHKQQPLENPKSKDDNTSMSYCICYSYSLLLNRFKLQTLETTWVPSKPMPLTIVLAPIPTFLTSFISIPIFLFNSSFVNVNMTKLVMNTISI